MVHAGIDAINNIKNNITDVVLLDVRLPDMIGLEVLKEIKKIDGYIEVVMLTAYDESKYAWEAAQSGACDYLTKPCDIPNLLIRVGKASASSVKNKKFRDNWAIIEKLRMLNHSEPVRASKIWDRLREVTEERGLANDTELPNEVMQEIFDTTL